MKQRTRNLLIHILGIIIFLSIPIFTSPDFGSGLKLIRIVPFQKSFFQFFLLLIVFYVNYYFFIPNYYFNKKNRFWFFIFLVIQFTIIILLPNFIFGTKPDLPHEIIHKEQNRESSIFLEAQTLIPFLLVVALALLLKINNRLVKLRSEKLSAEVSYLKAQINPHFLFNTLNSLYALTLQKSNDAPQAVLKLSGIMRYVTNESSKDFVSLDKEINYIKDYVDLQKLRLNEETTSLNFTITGNPENKQIAPLILIPFIENAFKYGVSTEEESKITISISIEETSLTLWATNTIVAIENIVGENTQKGLENTKKRLNFMYDNKHKLHVTDNKNQYSVELKLFLE